MARIEGACTAADSKKLLASTWFYIPSEVTAGVSEDGLQLRLLTFGAFQTQASTFTWNGSSYEPAAPSTYEPGQIAIDIWGDGSCHPYMQVRGRINQFTSPADFDENYFGGLHPSIFFGDDATVAPNVWHHMAVSLDLSGGASAFSYGDEGAAIELTDMAIGSWCYVDGVPFAGWNIGDVLLQGDTVNFEPGHAGGETWNMAHNGSVFSIHGRNWNTSSTAHGGGVVAYEDTNPQVRMAETQVWFNQAPDLSANIGKFIDNRGKPVDPAIARTAFGAPYGLFSRNKARNKPFERNQGSGGATAKTGTVSDSLSGPF